MPKYQDLSRSLAAFEQNSTLVAAIEMGSEGWLVGAFVPGLKKDPRKKLSPDKQSLLAQRSVERGGGQGGTGDQAGLCRL
jgi:transposase